MLRPVLAFLAIGLTAGAARAQPADSKAPWGALVDPVKAGEVVLAEVCLPGILNRMAISDLALKARLVAMPSKAANAGKDDQVFRLGSLTPVYAVAWADGSCSAYVDRSAPEPLRAMAERVILARPEGFVRGRSGPADGGRVERTVYCAQSGEDRLVATITTAAPNAARGTRALSSTVYRARGQSGLCTAG